MGFALFDPQEKGESKSCLPELKKERKQNGHCCGSLSGNTGNRFIAP
jgi:hypothetical protein